VACETGLPDADPPLAPATALALFRILQEALTNVARHSGAKNVRIGLTREGPSAILTIADDGRGIPPEVLARQTSLGLMGMRERVLAFGGTLELSATPGGGTTVVVRVPVGSPESR
jgi:signal transduction histidine kinase